ncbi:hypothetical protein [Secundilactobacillus paracollinoides]|nr:hypothetical protein [Secundilactobacillus paracollinoides]
MQQVYQVGSQFDSEVALNQKLTFDAAKMKFLQSSIAFDEKALQLFHDQDYNNAALLLSDQCQEVTKVAVFEGKEVDQFLDKRAYTGSIVTQIDATLNYLDSANHRRAIITGEAQRSERQDYPETAIREAVVNAFIHRDYMLHSNVKVEVFDDRLEILSPGGIPQG